ncbi:hypothetical protein V1477_003617 [Vespula maculifrons]|uniref:Uncharacterized protein n=1 Tax=Vespula maculifrons TaxID=7453 RepID=A0ABD2CT74_VESMC
MSLKGNSKRISLGVSFREMFQGSPRPIFCLAFVSGADSGSGGGGGDGGGGGGGGRGGEGGERGGGDIA